MLKVICVVCICVAAMTAVCETTTKYEVGTIMGVTPHPSATDDPSAGICTYEVSVKVAETIYVVLYTDTSRSVQYAGGHQLLVHVGKDTITYNDSLGQSHDAPIISRKPVMVAKQSK